MGIFDSFFSKKQNNKTQSAIEQIKKDGIEVASKRFAEIINTETIHSSNVAEQFIFEELDAARQGNEKAKEFARSSGIPTESYMHAMNNSWEEVDGPNGPQQKLLSFLMIFSEDMDFAVNLRLAIVEEIMKIWKLGKYSDRLVEELPNGTYSVLLRKHDLNDVRSLLSSIMQNGLFARLPLEQVINNGNKEEAIQEILDSIDLTIKNPNFENEFYENYEKIKFIFSSDQIKLILFIYQIFDNMKKRNGEESIYEYYVKFYKSVNVMISRSV